MTSRLYLLTFVLFFLQTVKSTAHQVTDFTFSHLGHAEGLCSERIYSVCQTADGALWWSNKEDIERYNGAVIRHFTLGGQNRYSDSAGRILKLTQQPNGTLMAFDNKGGIFEYQLATDSFIPVTDVSKLVGREVMLNDMTATANGLWLAMREGAYFFQNGALTPVVEGTYVSTIVKGSGQLLICTRDGVLEYVDNSQSTPQRGLSLRKVLTDHVECGFYDDHEGTVWLGGFQGGLHVMDADGKLWRVEGQIVSNPVRAICPYDNDTMLVGIDGLGVFKVNRRPADHHYRGDLLFDANDGKQGMLHGNGIYTVLRDSWGNVVIGSYSGGIDVARPVGSTPSVFQHVRANQQSLLNDRVNCVAQWPDGTLIMGTDNGVSMHDPKTQLWRHACHGAVVLGFCMTPQRTLLAATFGKGVYEITEQGEATLLYIKERGVLRDNHVYKIIYDRQGNLWMGCLDGDLVQKSADACRYYPIHNVQDIVQLPDDRIAVGTASGVWMINGTTGDYQELEYTLGDSDDVNRYVFTIFVNNDSELWIGTDGGGVYIYDLSTAVCRQLTQANGLPSNTVYSICRDNQSHILIATDKGLSFVESEAPETVINVNYCYGLEREYSARAVTCLHNGHVLYGTTSGALIIAPSNIQKINYTARLTITGVRCTDNDGPAFKQQVYDMLKAGKLRLNYDERTFDLFFESINLRNQFDIAYQFRVGDGEWSLPSTQQYIRFTNLEPGNHRLTLRAVSLTCGHVLDEKRLTIVVSEPWWNSWWMWVVYVSLILLAFYGAWRFYQLHTKYMRLVVNSLEREVDPQQTEPAADDDQPDNPETAANAKGAEGSEFIEKVTKIVADNLSDPDFNIDRLCREMAMSRTLFYIKLKTFTGNSPQEFIRVIRLERASTLLRGGHSVAETATLTGFDNTKYFSTVFKKYFGVSPSKYC